MKDLVFRLDIRTSALLRALAAVVVLLAAMHPPVAAQKVTLGKPLDDGALAFVDRFVAIVKDDPAGTKLAAMEPFVIGLYGFKAMRMANLGVGKLEAAHMTMCTSMLGFYDKEVDNTLRTIAARGTSPVDWPLPSEAERKAVQRFVVMKQFNRFGSFDDIANGTLPEIDERSKWQWEVGSALGELAADVTMWYRLPNYAPFDKSIGDYLDNIEKKLVAAPAGTPSSFIFAARQLTVLRSKPKYSVAERQLVAAELAKTIAAAAAFATAGKGFPKRTVTVASSTEPVRQTPAASPRPTPPNRYTVPTSPRPTPAPVVRPSATPATRPTPMTPPTITTGVRASTLLEDGKRLAAAGDHKGAIAKYDTAAGMDPQNGAIYYNRAVSRHKLDLIDEAISDATAAIRLKYSLPLSYYNRGTFYLGKNAFTLAIADLSQSINLAPNDHSAWYNRGVAHFNLSAFDPAYADVSKAINLNRRHVNSYILRARILCKKRLLLSAIADQEEAIKLGATVTKGCSQ